ncbi:hypothetical protein HC766_03770 [Candidatus Gracilibacteria bacterium]|nr:hypothetical protein [Candidatus Gracilibacteria bacterium]
MFEVNNWTYGKNKIYKTQLNEPSKNSISVISGITQNNGINYYTIDKLTEQEIFKEELTISTRGEYSGTVFYHSEKFVLANNILVMKMSNLTKNQKIFIGCQINSLSYGGYSGYPRKETLKNDKIQLPTKNGEIDFEFMESFIAELEAERVAELEAYLVATGLRDYNLTTEEEKVLEQFKSGDFNWGEFKIGELFNIATGRDVIIGRVVNGNIPLISHQHNNNGITKKLLN